MSENTESAGKTVEMNKPEKKSGIKAQAQTKKASRADKLEKDIGSVFNYSRGIANAASDAIKQIRLEFSYALLALYDETFKECLVVKESNITDEEAEKYYALVGPYYKDDKGNVIKIEPVEYNWTIESAEAIKYNTGDVGSEGKDHVVDGVSVKFKYDGIVTSESYPTTYQAEGLNEKHAFLKLREYLISINNKK